LILDFDVAQLKIDGIVMPTKSTTTKRPGEIAPPDLPKRLNPGFLDALEDQAIYQELLLAECDLSDQMAEFATFETMHFKQVAIQRAVLPKVRLADVRLEACDLAESICETISLSRVEFLGCRLIGLQATDGRIEDVLMKGCNASHAHFWGSVFKRARFEHCNLSEANFQGADLTGVVFDKCDLRGASLAGAKLAGADLRSSQIDGARAGIKELEGAIVNAEQAISIARMLGVDVRLD
jgi:uncharacterized protein YjbI with pentapeptide repeats